MQVVPEEADLDPRIRMFAGNVVMLATGQTSADVEEETAGTAEEEETTDEGATQGRDAGRQTDTSNEEAAEVTQERTNEEKEDVSVASKEATSRRTAQNEVAVEGTQETDTMTEEEILVEIAEELVMAAETWLETVEEMAVGKRTPVATSLAVAHLQENDVVVSVITQTANLVREKTTVHVTEVLVDMNVTSAEAPLITTSEREGLRIRSQVGIWLGYNFPIHSENLCKFFNHQSQLYKSPEQPETIDKTDQSEL